MNNVVINIVEKDSKYQSEINQMVEEHVSGYDRDCICIHNHDDVGSFLRNYTNVRPQLLFLDLDEEGIEAARAVRNISQSIQLVLCSSKRDFASESYELNASFFLLKPFNPKMINIMWDRLVL